MNKVFLTLAKDAISEVFKDKSEIDTDKLIKEYPQLKEKRAVFVTLSIEGRLRGCIGSLIPHRRLIDDIISNAKSAAFRDPRFAPLSIEEFKNIEFEISLLSVPYELKYSDIADLKSKIRPKIDGVILRHNANQATYLPTVWEQLESFEDFFASLCQKAGMQSECLKLHPVISVYQAEKIR